jgi:hypothetical protein
MKEKLNPKLKARVLEAKITKLEASLLKRLREIDYGEFIFTVHKIEGQPIRVTIESSSRSLILNADDGMNLEDVTYVR